MQNNFRITISLQLSGGERHPCDIVSRAALQGSEIALIPPLFPEGSLFSDMFVSIPLAEKAVPTFAVLVLCIAALPVLQGSRTPQRALSSSVILNTTRMNVPQG